MMKKEHVNQLNIVGSLMFLIVPGQQYSSTAQGNTVRVFGFVFTNFVPLWSLFWFLGWTKPGWW